MRAIRAGTVLAMLIATWSCSDEALPPPLTIDELRETTFDVTLAYERELDAGPGFTACP